MGINFSNYLPNDNKIVLARLGGAGLNDGNSETELEQLIEQNKNETNKHNLIEQEQLKLDEENKKQSEYWKRYIVNELTDNLNLFAEFELSKFDKTYHDVQMAFKSGYKLKEIRKKKLIELIKSIMETNFKDKQYIISTRSKNDSLHYYIIVSIIQQNNFIGNTNINTNTDT
jgi:hypothetical protein